LKPQILVPNKQHTQSKKTIPYNGLSLFTGTGIGEFFIKDFVNIQVANELLSDRAKVYEYFYSNTVMIQGDIKDKFVYDTIILESKKYNIDFIIATPPCESFSLAGKKNIYDIRTPLFIYIIDIV
jgi:DNA (cytosine-5)-methyltransferase 1